MASTMLARGLEIGSSCLTARRGGSHTQRLGFSAASLSCQPAATAAAAALVPSAASPACASGRHVDHCSNAWASPRQQQQRQGRRRAPLVAAAAAAMASVDEAPWGPSELAADVADMVAYAVKMAWTSETYQVRARQQVLCLHLAQCYACAFAITSGNQSIACRQTLAFRHCV